MASTTVVGAAIIRDGRLLAARRRGPTHLAGRWELPGGKVEPAESETEALARELEEELSIRAEIGHLVGRTAIALDSDTDTDTAPAPDTDTELAIYLCRTFTGEVQLGPDHDALTWLDAATVDSVEWLDADRMLLAEVARELR